jgi:hypothetical protein
MQMVIIKGQEADPVGYGKIIRDATARFPQPATLFLIERLFRPPQPDMGDRGTHEPSTSPRSHSMAHNEYFAGDGSLRLPKHGPAWPGYTTKGEACRSHTISPILPPMRPESHSHGPLRSWMKSARAFPIRSRQHPPGGLGPSFGWIKILPWHPPAY